MYSCAQTVGLWDSFYKAVFSQLAPKSVLRQGFGEHELQEKETTQGAVPALREKQPRIVACSCQASGASKSPDDLGDPISSILQQNALWD